MAHTQDAKGWLLLEDGRRFEGWLAGSGGVGTGEAVFTTTMTGYQEVLTDPSFASQIVVMTAPMIGNYGVAPGDGQSSRCWLSGFVVRELSGSAGGWRSDSDLRSFLCENHVPALHGVDTRALTRHIRTRGAMRAAIVPASMDPLDAEAVLRAEPEMRGRDLASQVGTSEEYTVAAAGEEQGVVLCLDYGVKRMGLRLLSAAGYRVEVIPPDTHPEEIVARSPSGLFVSSGPGDPEAVPGASEQVRLAAEAGISVFGICLGCQLIARAFGGRTYKLPYGHRGGNHPVRDLASRAVEITSQNHGFAVVNDGTGVAGTQALTITHLNLNDGTIEGLAHVEWPVFGVQYHPESAPGPHDSRYLFERFVVAMGGRAAPASYRQNLLCLASLEYRTRYRGVHSDPPARESPAPMRTRNVADSDGG